MMRETESFWLATWPLLAFLSKKQVLLFLYKKPHFISFVDTTLARRGPCRVLDTLTRKSRHVRRHEDPHNGG
jgi:hypothetical protein